MCKRLCVRLRLPLPAGYPVGAPLLPPCPRRKKQSAPDQSHDRRPDHDISRPQLTGPRDPRQPTNPSRRDESICCFVARYRRVLPLKARWTSTKCSTTAANSHVLNAWLRVQDSHPINTLLIMAFRADANACPARHRRNAGTRPLGIRRRSCKRPLDSPASSTGSQFPRCAVENA
jgi:hypothetical protein